MNKIREYIASMGHDNSEFHHAYRWLLKIDSPYERDNPNNPTEEDIIINLIKYLHMRGHYAEQGFLDHMKMCPNNRVLIKPPGDY